MFHLCEVKKEVELGVYRLRDSKRVYFLYIFLKGMINANNVVTFKTKSFLVSLMKENSEISKRYKKFKLATQENSTLNEY